LPVDFHWLAGIITIWPSEVLIYIWPGLKPLLAETSGLSSLNHMSSKNSFCRQKPNPVFGTVD